MSDGVFAEIDFGTSGLRGLAEGFTRANVVAYVGAFLKIIGKADGQDIVYLGADLRESSPRIVADCIAAVNAGGWQAVYAGNVPTPALAVYAMARDCPSIMVTGSHIPETHNGIKFYRRDGELTKENEAPIRKQAQQLLEVAPPVDPVALPPVDAGIARAYVARFTSAFPADALKGLRLGVDLHSAVGRDLLVEIIEALGATCFPFNRAERFVAVDTEALSLDDIARAKVRIKRHALDAVVSTDGDGDRPLLIDERGSQINGDVLGALTAQALGIATVVTPLSSTSAIEKSDWFEKIIRTNIGSPYVVAAMEEETNPGASVAGFEANGGFLTATDIELSEGILPRLPTRDAVLPLVAPLMAANARALSLSALASTLPARFMKADRIKQVSAEKAREFLDRIISSQVLRTRVDKRLADPVEINVQDGVRMSFEDSTIVHFRQSGNAPEMRLYVETGDRDLTERLLGEIKHGLGIYLGAVELPDE